MKRFADLIERQLAMFTEDNAELIAACLDAERAYDRAGREEAEERYAEYLELVEEAGEALQEIRVTYAATLDPEDARAYERAFDREATHRFPRFELGL
ncbi:MAG TPA: hypothetical protein VJT84_11865 [Gaiellaceae bacterium]|nr:hypothetical protein [Gaiellaceae bacterium]